MFCLPGYALYKLNTSEMVRGDLEQKLPKRPDLPQGGNASNRVYSPGEQKLQDMLQKVELVRGLPKAYRDGSSPTAPAPWCWHNDWAVSRSQGERVELATPHDVPEEVIKKTGMAQHPISHAGYRW